MKAAGLMIALALVLAGCSGSGATTTTTAKAEPVKPTFTDEEKAAMTTDEKTAIYNATAESQDQVVCRRQVVTGSHRKKMVCRTSSQIKADQDAAHETMRDSFRGTASDPAGGN